MMHQNLSDVTRSVFAASLGEQDEERLLAKNFFELGGDSLRAARVVRQLRSATGLPVTLRDLFEHPLASDLAAHLADKHRSAADG